MTETRTAKLFKNGASQAVRLPAEFRFPGSEVHIRRSKNGDVILSPLPKTKTWADFIEFAKTITVPDEFMKDRPMNRLPVERDLFLSDEQE